MSKTTELTVCQQSWLEHVLACDKSQSTAKDYADEHGLSVSGLYNARSVLKKKGAWSGGDEDLATAPLPPQPIPKSMATAATLAFIVTSKFVDGLPLYRQETMLGRIDIDISRQTLARWVIQSGILMTDAYAGYDAVVRANQLSHAGCWAHARRKFNEALKAQTAKGKKTKAGKATRALGFICTLYRVEHLATNQGLSLAQRLVFRQEHAQTIIDKLQAWLQTSLSQVPP